MTNKTQEIYFDSILLDMKAINPKQVYQKLAKHISTLTGTAENDLLDVLLKNEDHQNSGIGNGVAVAQAYLPRLTCPMVIYAKITNAIDFCAADGEPVDIVVLVLSPEFEEKSKHLQQLATMARFLSDKETCEALRHATSFESVRMVTKKINQRKKAA